MIREFLRVKIHRATITTADLNYIGSITIPGDLCDQVGLLQGEKVDVLDITNGERLTTYVIRGETARQFQMNGAAAHKVSPGDLVIIVAYCGLSEDEVADHSATIAIMTPDNAVERIIAFKATPNR
ncbi:MAG: aspartate 1-decarboxylase [Planctomycetota bacterium]